MAQNKADLFSTNLVEPLKSVLVFDPTGQMKLENFSIKDAVTTIKAGHLAKEDRTQKANGIDIMGAGAGTAWDVDDLILVEIPRTHINMNGNWNKDDAFPEKASLQGYRLDESCIGAIIWLRCDNKTYAPGTVLKTATAGLVEVIGDIDGTTFEKQEWGFRSQKRIAAKDWILVKFIGKIYFDDS